MQTPATRQSLLRPSANQSTARSIRQVPDVRIGACPSCDAVPILPGRIRSPPFPADGLLLERSGSKAGRERLSWFEEEMLECRVCGSFEARVIIEVILFWKVAYRICRRLSGCLSGCFCCGCVVLERWRVWSV